MNVAQSTSIDGIEIQRLGHSCFKLKMGEKIIYTNPQNIPDGAEKADIIIMGHEYDERKVIFDNFQKITREDTVIITNIVVHPIIVASGLFINELVVIGAHERYPGTGFEALSIPAYTLTKVDEHGNPYHSRDDQSIGIVLTINGKSVYFASATDFIPEMEKLEHIDIAILPVSGKTVMTPEEAAKAIESFKPKNAIPMSYDGDAKEQEEQFKELAQTNITLL